MPPGAVTASIIRDCNALLHDGYDPIRGTGSPNWKDTRTMPEWNGIAVEQCCTAANPCYKVSSIVLDNKSFIGRARPSGLIKMDGLKPLVMYDELTGELPPESRRRPTGRCCICTATS